MTLDKSKKPQIWIKWMVLGYILTKYHKNIIFEKCPRDLKLLTDKTVKTGHFIKISPFSVERKTCFANLRWLILHEYFRALLYSFGCDKIDFGPKTSFQPVSPSWDWTLRKLVNFDLKSLKMSVFQIFQLWVFKLINSCCQI